jgi:GNAT superfamily N-acetyltransferase
MMIDLQRANLHSAAIDSISIRDGRDTDSAALIALIGAVYAEYPGCILDMEREEPMLLAPATRLAELVKLYVAKRARGRGLGTRLVGTVESAVSPAFACIELWSDTRFTDSHRLYEHLGYRRSPHTRTLDDLSHTTEYHYAKALDSALTRMSA